MSKRKQSTSDYLNSIKDKEDTNAQEKEKSSSKRDRTYILPAKFKSQIPKKDNQTFFVSRINKPAKYTKNSNFFSQLIYKIGKDDASGLAAQLSYYFMLSLFPMLIFLLSVVSITISKSQVDKLIKQAQAHAPADYKQNIGSVLHDILNQGSGLGLVIGLILALWSASNGMTALMNSFNVAYDVEDNRNFVVSKLLSVLFTLAMVLILPIALILPAFGKQISDLLFGPLGLDGAIKPVFSIIQTVLPLIVIFVAFTVLYTLAPNVKIKLKSVIPGAIFSTIAFLVGTLLFSFYISNFSNYSKTYGSLAGVIILMFWLYITGFIIIIGAEINAIMHQRKIVSGKTPEEQSFAKLEEFQRLKKQNQQGKNSTYMTDDHDVNDYVHHDHSHEDKSTTQHRD
ncbi:MULTISPECIES: YihY/virulence factor BrkB family protein [Staphylococcus]|uniref:YihY/virulence factor BrkB family protein n=1 Tax=Staphylococcus hsinchuensis TaxID=3051183 RepID=A0ABZ3EDG4_9STAP|nr:YihY/virulence factor BrkB family protein [Staphylococcus sp. Marseille-Q6910]